MSTTSPMTLDDLIDTLATANPALILLRGFDSPHGSRATNLYPALGFEPARRITISAMLAAARSAKGSKVISHGGEFIVTGSTPCWLDFTGMTAGLEITPELLADYIAAGSVPSPLRDQGRPLSAAVPRAAVITELEDADWHRQDRHQFPLLKHKSGICWELLNDAGGCALDFPNGTSTPFTRATPDAVVIAACLAATGQLDPTVDRAYLEERASWLTWLERAGLDNWPGVDEARRMRAEAESS